MPKTKTAGLAYSLIRRLKNYFELTAYFAALSSCLASFTFAPSSFF
jgi:hypothetical protein